MPTGWISRASDTDAPDARLRWLTRLRRLFGQLILELQPGYVRVVEHVSGWLPIQRPMDQGSRDVHFIGPSHGGKQHRTSASWTKGALGARTRLVPAGLSAGGIDGDTIRLKAGPGDQRRPMGSLAISAVAMSDPLGWECSRKADGTAEARAMNFRLGHDAGWRPAGPLE